MTMDRKTNEGKGSSPSGNGWVRRLWQAPPGVDSYEVGDESVSSEEGS